MRIRTAGKVNEKIWYLGRKESGMYLLTGERESMLISAGISFVLADVLEQMQKFGIDADRISSLLILHAHFDHVGTVPYFKRKYPALKVYASQRAWDILSMPKAIETMNSFSRMVAEKAGCGDVLDGYDLEWRNDVPGTTVGDGDVLKLEDLEVHILETPGHSSCSIAAYIPALKTLLPSDAGGIPIDAAIFPSGNSNYTQYQQSLEKMKDLEVDYYGADHYGYIVGAEARDYVRDSITAAGELRGRIEKVYGETKDIDRAARLLTEELYTNHPDYFLAPEIIVGVFGQMVKHIAKAKDAPKTGSAL
ncbi:MAG TPA: MBL fold metallo-hydrolase [Syntrophales bacterium]|jgi:glyoxylase-like metal-dependent hydrolase (beta-lactamase superfamily II)|nr:MBL fold metallo-hydrolase [Syntrophales bacterium]HOO41790.1 MBL fold metallo-hydrolase [Syntrophales bacterium]HOU76634.1 MBL fold metallo-hydrolase [Syntrophales bacterium]HPC31391.1 MBL fold metallo-hydrolase [Syntrophales bacterium]HQG33297.1 MBL fold metallo-hydrolase [Syntrophales bacterium]